jgi:hypothetical protein
VTMLYTYFTAHRLRIIASIFAAIVLVLAAWIPFDSTLIAGQIELNGSSWRSTQIASVSLPGFDYDKHVVLSRQQAETIKTGDWVLLRGSARETRRHTIHSVDSLQSLPQWMTGTVSSIASWYESLHNPSAGHRAILLMSGAVVLLLGVFALRVVSAIVLAALLMIAGWCAVSIGLIYELPGSGPWLLAAIPLVGAGSGLILGGAHGSMWGYLTQRIGMMALLMLLSPAIALQFGWPTHLTLIIALAGSLVTPLVGLWLIGGFAIAAGIEGSALAGNLILGVAGLMVHVASGGSWLSSIFIPLRGGNRTSKCADGQIPLADFVK